MSVTTTDLTDFGSRERGTLVTLLTAWSTQGLPKDFDNYEVVPMLNKDSGNVFLTNSNYDVAMLHGSKLESFYYCPECGHEGFAEDIEHDDSLQGCTEFLESILGEKI
jgi:hypothetical protein